MEEPKEAGGYVVDGYLFTTQEEAQAARKEFQGIKYLQKNNNLKDAEVMLQVYQKLLDQGMFHTLIGLNYLKELQDTLRKQGVADSLPPIPAVDAGMKRNSAGEMNKEMEKLEEAAAGSRRKFRISLGIILVLILGLAFMVAVALTTNQPNILNYEEKIIDKYETWENELNEREQLLQEREEQLDKTKQ